MSRDGYIYSYLSMFLLSSIVVSLSFIHSFFTLSLCAVIHSNSCAISLLYLSIMHMKLASVLLAGASVCSAHTIFTYLEIDGVTGGTKYSLAHISIGSVVNI